MQKSWTKMNKKDPTWTPLRSKELSRGLIVKQLLRS